MLLPMLVIVKDRHKGHSSLPAMDRGPDGRLPQSALARGILGDVGASSSASHEMAPARSPSKGLNTLEVLPGGGLVESGGVGLVEVSQI